MTGKPPSKYCPRGQHRGTWEHGSPPLDRFTDGSGWACPGMAPDGAACGYELRVGTAVSGADPLDEVAGKVRDAMTMTDGRLMAALDEIRGRSERPLASAGSLPISHDGVRGLMASAADVPRLLAAIDRALALTDPFTNPTKGGTFLAAVGVQVREAILAELAGDETGRAQGGAGQ